MSNPRKTHGGKGDGARKVNKQKFDSNWDRIFGNSNEKETDKRTEDPQGQESSGDSNKGSQG